MDEKLIEGKVTFVQHDKKYVSIEYLHNGKVKSVNGSIREEDLARERVPAKNKVPHYFREGDEVSFILTKSLRGDKMIADKILYRFNNSLNVLLHKASTENNFLGYIKQVDDKYFIKELDSYHFFPLKLSPWEKEFSAADLNEAVPFTLENFSKPDKTMAVLRNRQFIPEFKKAKQYLESKTVVDAQVFKTTPHGIYLNVVGKKVQAKIPLSDKAGDNEKPGDLIKIIITYLGPEKIVVARV
jgi:ribosomal protein S1